VRAAVSLDRFENKLLLIALRYCPPLPTPRVNIFVTIWAKLGSKMCAYLLIVNIYALRGLDLSRRAGLPIVAGLGSKFLRLSIIYNTS
jgi:hypothetical protein